MSGAWTGIENDIIVADYFDMLRSDVLGQPYSKAEHRRALTPLLNDRSEGSIEFKHQNVSAVLRGMGEDWIRGYKPAMNFQITLIDAVARYLAVNRGWSEGLIRSAPPPRDRKIILGDIPALKVPEKEIGETLRIARKYDTAGRDDRNRTLGHAGEEAVFFRERDLLISSGREDLARKVRWTSQEDGDGAGYDIASFKPDGARRLIEVKTTNCWDRTPFHISRNELDASADLGKEWTLMRVWNFSRGPRAFELSPPLGNHVNLSATAYLGSFH